MAASLPLLQQAALALRMRRFAEAEQHARDVLKANRHDSAAVEILAHALLRQGRAEEAIAPLRRIVRRGGDPGLETLLAKALAANGETDAALEQLRKTTALRPPFAPAFLELADQLGKAGRATDAIAALEEGLALLPDAIDLQMGLGHLTARHGDRNKARQLFTQVRAVAPERHDAMIALARLLAREGEHAEAADLFRHALGLRPDDAVTRLNLGKSLLALRERDAGEAALRAAVESAAPLAGAAITALASSPHGRLFLKPSAAAKFLRGRKD